MNKLESRGQKLFWFVLFISLLPHLEILAGIFYYLGQKEAWENIDIVSLDMGEAFFKIIIFSILFWGMNKGYTWLKHVYAILLFTLFIGYYVVQSYLDGLEYFTQLSSKSWMIGITTSIIFFIGPSILLYVMPSIKAFLTFRAGKGDQMTYKINQIGG